ncbi:hypothetical protein BZA77DRAFT_330978, partial [Pyronema omphalodes]
MGGESSFVLFCFGIFLFFAFISGGWEYFRYFCFRFRHFSYLGVYLSFCFGFHLCFFLVFHISEYIFRFCFLFLFIFMGVGCTFVFFIFLIFSISSVFFLFFRCSFSYLFFSWIRSISFVSIWLSLSWYLFSFLLLPLYCFFLLFYLVIFLLVSAVFFSSCHLGVYLSFGFHFISAITRWRSLFCIYVA